MVISTALLKMFLYTVGGALTDCDIRIKENCHEQFVFALISQSVSGLSTPTHDIIFFNFLQMSHNGLLTNQAKISTDETEIENSNMGDLLNF